MNPVLWARRLVLLLAVLVEPAIAAACSSTTFVSGNAAPGAAADADGGPAEGGSPRGSCDDYLACTEAVSATPIAPLVEQFGVNGTCWQSDAAATATGCRDACERGLLQLRGQFPEAVACGGTDHDLNPYGARYPTSDIGTTERRGARPGKRIKNFGFQGYLNGKKNELTNVYLASFYDPKQELSPTPIKLLHIQVVAAWVPTAKQESADFQGMAEALRARGVAWLTVVAEGARPGAVATVADLDSWVNSFPRGEGIVLDPAANLSVFFDAAALPLNLWIDARSMHPRQALTRGDPTPSWRRTGSGAPQLPGVHRHRRTSHRARVGTPVVRKALARGRVATHEPLPELERRLDLLVRDGIGEERRDLLPREQPVVERLDLGVELLPLHASALRFSASSSEMSARSR
jgi:hypothetical protein